MRNAIKLIVLAVIAVIVYNMCRGDRAHGSRALERSPETVNIGVGRYAFRAEETVPRLNMLCETGGIKVESAILGPITPQKDNPKCKFLNITDGLNAKVSDAGFYIFRPANLVRTFGDPCPNTAKQFTVNYSCPKVAGFSKNI